jgi:O-acetyl-ADP-ribose deacetylase (regulator of RNase III)
MKIIYKHGDLLKAEEKFIIQGCNAQGVMGSGVAKLLRDADEKVFSDYRKVYEDQGLKVGEVIWVPSAALAKTVVNVISQEFYGREPGVVYVSYAGLREAMKKIDEHAKSIKSFDFSPPVAMALPLIGAGLAQGKWSVIAEILEEESKNWQPVVYLFDGLIPDGVEADVVAA